MLNEADHRVVQVIGRSATCATAKAIAPAHLGHRAKTHSKDSLNMVGLHVAARLCGEQVLKPTKTNRVRS
jgi:hypothetical protein